MVTYGGGSILGKQNVWESSKIKSNALNRVCLDNINNVQTRYINVYLMNKMA